MSSFTQSTSGRLITLSLSLALLGGGAGAVVGGVPGFTLLGLGLMLGVVASIIGVAVGIEQHGETLAIYVLMVPWVLFLYGVGTLVAFSYQPNVGYLLIAAGLAAITRAIFISEAREAAPREARSLMA